MSRSKILTCMMKSHRILSSVVKLCTNGDASLAHLHNTPWYTLINVTRTLWPRITSRWVAQPLLFVAFRKFLNASLLSGWHATILLHNRAPASGMCLQRETKRWSTLVCVISMLPRYRRIKSDWLILWPIDQIWLVDTMKECQHNHVQSVLIFNSSPKETNNI